MKAVTVELEVCGGVLRCAAPLVEHGAADEAKITQCVAIYDIM